MLLNSGEIGDPCGVPFRSRRARFVRRRPPRPSSSSTAISSHALTQPNSRPSLTRRAMDFIRSASKIGDNTSIAAVCATQSRRHGMPNGRNFPRCFFGMALVHESELARNEPDSQVHHLPRAYDDGLPSSAMRLRM